MLARRALLVLAAGPAFSSPASFESAIQQFTTGRKAQVGRVQLQVSELVENGHTVPITVSVDGADRVLRMMLIAELNPAPEVFQVQFGLHSGRPQLSTRIRLATSQTLLALAEMADGSIWQQPARVIVTLAACVEGG